MNTRLILILFVLSLPLASAEYISGKIDVFSDGRASFNLNTDVQINLVGLKFEENKITGITSALTKKEGEIWTFDLSQFPRYDEIFLEIQLPKNLKEIIQINGTNKAIDLEKKLIIMVGSGSPELSIQYTLGNYVNYSAIIWPLLALIIIIGFILYKKAKRKKERLNLIMPMISDNEQKIIDLLMKKPMRQKDLRKHLEIPKASFSRYLSNLEKKKLIIREGEGKNKVVKLK